MKKFFTLIAVAMMAFAAQANVLTVCDGEATNEFVPVYGLYLDTKNTTAQMIYPADMLTEMQGGKITEIKFYSARVFDSRLTTCSLQLSLMVVDEDRFEGETIDVINGTLAVSSTSFVEGATELVFTLAEPYEYTGGNLLVETLVTDAGGIRTTEFYGVEQEYNCSLYKYTWATWSGPSINPSNFMPKVSFTYEAGNPAQTDAPSYVTWTGIDGDHTYYVEFLAAEESCVLEYRYKFNDGDWTEWLPYDAVLAFTIDGDYEVECRAQAPGKEWSEATPVTFTITPRTSIDELNAGKAVAAVRYFNVAGQEMQQPQGLTIVVTTFTDGTSSAVKVMK